MKALSVVLAVGLVCAMGNTGAAWADEAEVLISFGPSSGVDPVDDGTLDLQMGLGLSTDTLIPVQDLGSDFAVILWDEAKPRGHGGSVTGQVGASISISVSGG